MPVVGIINPGAVNGIVRFPTCLVWAGINIVYLVIGKLIIFGLDRKLPDITFIPIARGIGREVGVVGFIDPPIVRRSPIKSSGGTRIIAVSILLCYTRVIDAIYVVFVIAKVDSVLGVTIYVISRLPGKDHFRSYVCFPIIGVWGKGTCGVATWTFGWAVAIVYFIRVVIRISRYDDGVEKQAGLTRPDAQSVDAGYINIINRRPTRVGE